MADEIKVGSIVRLKSGGPSMTVTKVGSPLYSSQPTVWCSWFDEKGLKQESTFPPDAVELVTD